jgi:hypothetical protein
MRSWWLIVDGGQVDLCLENSGYEIDVFLSTALRTMTQVWMGDMSLAQAREKRLLSVSGPARLVRTLSSWLGASPFADIPSARMKVAAIV